MTRGAQVLKSSRGLLSASSMARRLDVPVSTLLRWEKGEQVPSGRYLVLLQAELGIKPEMWFEEIGEAAVVETRLDQ